MNLLVILLTTIPFVFAWLALDALPLDAATATRERRRLLEMLNRSLKS